MLSQDPGPGLSLSLQERPCCLWGHYLVRTRDVRWDGTFQEQELGRI